MFMAAGTAEARFSDEWEPLNGNQELIAHPSLSYIYYGGNSEVTVFNYGTGTMTAEPLTGANAYVSSMDISADGTTLAAACESTIYIMPLASGIPASISTIGSDKGIIKSLCFGQGNIFYVTYEGNYNIDTYTTSGYVGNSVDAGNNCVLEASESRTALLAGEMGSADSTTIIKYAISSNPAVAPSETGRYDSSVGKLAQFEATDSTIYMACTNAAGIQVISLGSMSLINTYTMMAKPSGVALSRDNSVVYGISSGGSSYATGSSAIYAFDTSGNQLSLKYVAYRAGPVVPTQNSWTIGTVSPLHLETIGPEISAYSPAAGSSYTYSPGYIRFNITHDPVISTGEVTATVDGTPQTVASMESNVYQINLTSALPAATHTVNVEVKWGSMTVPASWTFVSGSTSASALRPALSLVSPAHGTTTDVSPSKIVLGIAMPAPPPFKTNVTMTINDLTLNAVPDATDPTRYVATLPTGLDLTGLNNVTAHADVDGFVVTGSWNFTVSEVTLPETPYDMVRYGENFTIPSPTAWTEQYDFGGWELVITGPSYNEISTNVFVDIAHDNTVRGNEAYINAYAQTILSDTIDGGDAAEMVGDVNHTAISNLTAGVWKMRLIDAGVQEAYALIVDEVNGDRWLIKCSASDTNFIYIWPIFEHMISGVKIIAPGSAPADTPPSTQGYAYYRMLGDYQLMVPDNWTIKREASSGETNFSLKLTGPKVGDFHVTMLLQNGTDPSIQDDRAWLLSLVQNKFMPDLEAKGVEASVYEEARILSISNHITLVFSIKWTGLENNMSLVQEIYYIVDESGHRYWMFTCEAPEDAYHTYAQIFDKVAQSFTPLSKSSTSTMDGGLFSDPTTMLMIAVLAVTGVAAAIVFVVVKRFRPRT
jgi:hypothetical protein